jgi:hypothetical protein
MVAFTFLYGHILLLALIMGGLAYMVAPHAGREIIKRAGVSVLLFFGGAYLLHCGGASLLGRSPVVINAGVLFCAALLWIVYPTGASELVRRVVALTLATIAAYAVLKWLWMDRIGRVVIGALVLVLIIAGVAARPTQRMKGKTNGGP